MLVQWGAPQEYQSLRTSSSSYRSSVLLVRARLRQQRPPLSSLVLAGGLVPFVLLLLLRGSTLTNQRKRFRRRWFQNQNRSNHECFQPCEAQINESFPSDSGWIVSVGSQQNLQVRSCPRVSAAGLNFVPDSHHSWGVEAEGTPPMAFLLQVRKESRPQVKEFRCLWGSWSVMLWGPLLVQENSTKSVLHKRINPFCFRIRFTCKHNEGNCFLVTWVPPAAEGTAWTLTQLF